MQRSLTQGPITKGILLFALPLMFGNLLQQMYNIADTWVVGRFLGADALAAVGSSYTLMTFLTSILLGLCMGSGAAISMQYGSGEYDKMRQSVFQSFVLIAGMALVLNLLVYLGLDGILWVLRVPEELKLLMKDYLVIIFLGITATFLYNYFANLLRAIGNSVVPLLFLAVSAVLFALTYHLDERWLGFGGLRLALPDAWYANYFTAFFGFPPFDFYSTDYFALLPWLFLFWAGYFLHGVVGRARMEPLRRSVCPALGWMGRHSLVLYLLHQPVLYGVLNSVFYLLR